jgi:hypothetical protein
MHFKVNHGRAINSQRLEAITKPAIDEQAHQQLFQLSELLRLPWQQNVL